MERDEPDEEGEEGEEDHLRAGGAWYDSDDETVTVSLTSTSRLRKLRKTEDEDTVNGKIYTRRLRQQFERIYPVPDWANPAQPHRRKKRDSQDSADEEDMMPTDPLSALFQSSAQLTRRSSTVLPDDILAIAPVAPIPFVTGNPTPRTLNFHPFRPLLLIGSQDRTLRIHSIDGKSNPLATSLRVPYLRIHSALFHPTRDLVYTTGIRRREIYIWDLRNGSVRKITKTFNEESMSSGQWTNLKISADGGVVGVTGAPGWLCFLNGKSGVYMGGCKVEGTIADYVFTRDGSGVIIVSVEGDIWEFDTASVLLTNRWRDEGGVSLTRVALSPDDRFLAIGSVSGIVTVYDLPSRVQSPVKTFYNLTTPITALEFSPDGQILVMASSGKRDQLRAVHVPSFKVFPNWPTSKTPLGVVECMTLGESGYLAVGRRKGVALWKIRDL